MGVNAMAPGRATAGAGSAASGHRPSDPAQSHACAGLTRAAGSSWQCCCSSCILTKPKSHKLESWLCGRTHRGAAARAGLWPTPQTTTITMCDGPVRDPQLHTARRQLSWMFGRSFLRHEVDRNDVDHLCCAARSWRVRASAQHGGSERDSRFQGRLTCTAARCHSVTAS